MTVTVGATVSVGIQNDVNLDPSTKTISHTPNSNTTVLVVAVGVPDDKDFASVTWNGVAMTLVDNYYPDVLLARRMGVYYATNDLVDTHDVVVTLVSGAGGRFGATVLNLIGAKAAAPFGTPVETTGSSVTSITSDSVTGDFILDFVISGGGSILTVGAGQTPIDGRGAGDDNGIAASSRFGVSSKTGPTTMGWSMNASSNWVHVAIAVEPGSDDVPVRVRAVRISSIRPTARQISNLLVRAVQTNSVVQVARQINDVKVRAQT